MRLRPALLGTGLAAVLAAVLLGLANKPGAEDRHATFTRPDGRFAIVVVRQRAWRPALPGQGSDGPGEVQLQDAQGRILKRAPVEMVQLVDNVQWLDRHVVIKLVADWPLPP